MKPVAIFQHDKIQRPGYLLSFLQQRGIPTRIIAPMEGDPIPHSAESFSGLIFLGSNGSVNDPLPWIARERLLMQDAVSRDVPILGHCFGGQLLSTALGGRVTRNATPCIGWSKLRVTPDSRHWFGGATEVNAFNWHYETFSIPPGAKRTLFGTHCLNKGFSMGKHLAFQCHLEVTEEIVRDWCAEGHLELETNPGAAVQAESQILFGLPQRVASLHKVAHSVYVQWMAGLPRPQTAHYCGGW
ncbi:MAG: type 1 glutamine amidotransferase [Rhizobiales bacterium]|nr:type 1 glutamine amidotransferase [Rhizobacter sp.]